MTICFIIITYITNKTVTINFLHIDRNLITYKKVYKCYQFYRNTITALKLYLFALFYENALRVIPRIKRQKS